MASKAGQSPATTTEAGQALRKRRPKDAAAAKKVDLLMKNAGLSAELLGAQIGVSGKRIRQIVDDKDEPQRRVKYAIARRFQLLPADIWKRDGQGLTPSDMDHLRALAARQEAIA